jgi:DNA-binding LytR/AlgR family response regulator
VGNQLRMVPVAEVLHLEAADKYVRVFTIDGAEVLLQLRSTARHCRAASSEIHRKPLRLLRFVAARVASCPGNAATA